MNLLTYLEQRQLGYAGLRKNVYDIFFEQIGFLPRKNDLEHNTNIDIGNTFACKFSRNKNNLHMVGCSTELGEMVIENTFNYSDTTNIQFQKTKIHDNAIFNFAWAEPQMKLVTACGDQTSKLCNLNPSGKLDEERQFMCNTSVKSVMFCPESSNVFCGGCQDGSIKIWDARINNNNTVFDFDRNIPYAHGLYNPVSKTRESRKGFGISTVIFKNELTVISSSAMDSAIKVWDLRKSYRQVKMNTEPLPLLKYLHPLNNTQRHIGFSDMIINPQSTYLYGSGVNNVIYCYVLDSTERSPVFEYSGHFHETPYSKISMSNDGRYLFTGCMKRTGLVWLTDFPFIQKPSYKINSDDFKTELSSSDWCADSTCIKLASSADSMPMIWSVITGELTADVDLKMMKTQFCNPRSYLKNYYTAPIKFDDELREKYKIETEKNMESWDIHHHNLPPNVDNLQVTPKKPWDVLFTKTKSPSFSQISPQSDSKSSSVVPNHIPDVVTPTSSRKRKKSMISPRSLIDQYLVPNNKRGKLDTVTEI